MFDYLTIVDGSLHDTLHNLDMYGFMYSTKVFLSSSFLPYFYIQVADWSHCMIMSTEACAGSTKGKREPVRMVRCHLSDRGTALSLQLILTVLRTLRLRKYLLIILPLLLQRLFLVV